MSGLNLLGGLAQGVTQGLNNTMNIQNNRARQKESDARLAMLQDEHNWKQQQREAQKQEQERADTYGKLQMRIRSEYGDRPREEQEAMIVKYGLETGLMRPEEYDSAMKSKAELDRMGVTNGLKQAFMTGDASALSKAYGIEIQAKPFKNQWGENDLAFVLPNGNQLTASQFAALEGVDLFAKMQQEQRENAKAVGGIAKDKASASASYASANSANALARQRTLENEGLAKLSPEQRASRGASGSGGGPLSTIGKEAADMVRIGMAKDEGEAMKILRGDKSISQALQVVLSNPEILYSKEPEEIAARVRAVSQRLKSQVDQDDDGGGADPLGLFN